MKPEYSRCYRCFRPSQYLRGWINDCGIATGYQRCCDLDHWLRRRVRMAYWRQWRKPRTKVRNLMKLGVQVKAAVACGITSKGPWRSSKTPGIQQTLSNDYLKTEGLASLRDGWINQASPFPVKRPVRSRMQGVVGAGG
ncbi:hypothetical protein J2887_12535 [Marinobacter sp. CA1]|nr:hypothetical protein J2887_12535 [Marinobacter sp. CA1]